MGWAMCNVRWSSGRGVWAIWIVNCDRVLSAQTYFHQKTTILRNWTCKPQWKRTPCLACQFWYVYPMLMNGSWWSEPNIQMDHFCCVSLVVLAHCEEGSAVKVGLRRVLQWWPQSSIEPWKSDDPGLEVIANMDVDCFFRLPALNECVLEHGVVFGELWRMVCFVSKRICRLRITSGELHNSQLLLSHT